MISAMVFVSIMYHNKNRLNKQLLILGNYYILFIYLFISISGKHVYGLEGRSHPILSDQRRSSKLAMPEAKPSLKNIICEGAYY